jgi:hypothetical protein
MFKNDIPVLFLIFNRIDTTKEVFESIKSAKPPKLYIASDGARKSKEGEEIIVNELRDYIIKSIDWNCEVITLFRNINLGCKAAVSGAVDWFFENEEMGIILEDDCLPSLSFFKFCQETLVKYKFDERVSGVSGSNFKSSLNLNNQDSYFFSEILYMWGWATWRRSWQLNKKFTENFLELRNKSQIDNVTSNKVANQMWMSESEKAIKGEIDTWDYQWLFANICDHKLAIYPSENLILNIGFDENATHTKHVRDELIVTQKQIDFPLTHPNFMIRNNNYDQFFYSNIYGWATIKTRIITKLKKIFNF